MAVLFCIWIFCWILSKRDGTESTKLSVITARKRSCGKVMFLHLYVILLTGKVCTPWSHTLWTHKHPWTHTSGHIPLLRSTSGRYAIYWNAFLLQKYICWYCFFYCLLYFMSNVEFTCLTSLTRAKCGTRSTLCWKVGNISGSTELFAL